MEQDIQVDAGLVALRACGDALPGFDQDVDDSVRIDRIRAFEELYAKIAAAQARETAAFVTSQRGKQQAAGVPAERVGRGIAAQVGLARRISPYQASRYVGWAMILTSELPATYTALAAGEVSEARALLVAKETIWLSREHRAVADRELAPQLATLGDRRVEAEAKKIGYRLDPAGYVARSRNAVNDRYVSLRPAPDTMTRLTALLPVTQGVACYAALKTAADLAPGDDGRDRGQVMADTLVQRITGQASAGQVPVTVNLLMTETALLGESDEPATVLAEGTPAAVIPAELALRAVLDPTGQTSVFLRRLYTRPRTTELVAMESKARLFTHAQRTFLMLRDQTCRTPWCDAPIRHADHITPYEQGGPTSLTNGAGTCEACNHTKQAPGWHQRTDGPDIITTTPTGHHYRSSPPRAQSEPAGRPRWQSWPHSPFPAGSGRTLRFPEPTPPQRRAPR